MSFPEIADLGFISDCRSCALVTSTGSVVWWCPERFDSPSVFARLLDVDTGHWSITPTQPAAVTRAYVGASLVLRTTFETDAGTVTITDALAAEPGARGHELGMHSPAVLVRLVEGVRGSVELDLELAPRHEYGRVTPHLVERDGALLAVGGQATLALRSPVPIKVQDDMGSARFVVAQGERLGFTLAYGTDGHEPAVLDPAEAIAETVATWESWSEEHQHYDGEHADLVYRSGRVLQGLTYQRTGAVVAAATTSLPEEIGADRNYDYRYSWLRDFSFTMRALWVSACPDESDRLLQAVAGAIGRVGPHPVPVMSGVQGQRDLTEHELEHMAGYRGSAPVRVGNAAWQQQQLDVLGEVIDAAYQLKDSVDEFGTETRAVLIGLANKAADTWDGPDAGMWEARDVERHYLSSKVMCWVAMDRAVELAPDLVVDDATVERWTKVREDVRTEVLLRGWNDEVGAYTGAFDSDELDASVLVLPLVGFLPATDSRMRSTIDVIERELGTGALLRRWAEDPAGFVLCSFWLVECLALCGELDRADAIFERVVSYANDLGLLAEQLDLETGAHLGNTPQALSHIGLINAAWRLTEARRERGERTDRSESGSADSD